MSTDGNVDTLGQQERQSIATICNLHVMLVESVGRDGVAMSKLFRVVRGGYVAGNTAAADRRKDRSWKSTDQVLALACSRCSITTLGRCAMLCSDVPINVPF